MAEPDAWPLRPGTKIRRKRLHDTYGGSRQGGISPSRQSPNVFLFTDPSTGEQHGYMDSWKEDGCFHYTGEGQKGDQVMAHGNLAVFQASQEGRTIRLFDGSGGDVTYIGAFELDRERPYYVTDAPETGGGPVRSVFVFQLRPIDVAPGAPAGFPPPVLETNVDKVAIEAMNSERAFVEPARSEYEAERRESALVQRYVREAESAGHIVRRLKIQPAGEAKPIFCDVYIEDQNLLIEAKGAVDRQSVRMAIGQLLDYCRFTEPMAQCAILLPSRPREDLVELIRSVDIELIWEYHGGFWRE